MRVPTAMRFAAFLSGRPETQMAQSASLPVILSAAHFVILS